MYLASCIQSNIKVVGVDGLFISRKGLNIYIHIHTHIYIYKLLQVQSEHLKTYMDQMGI